MKSGTSNGSRCRNFGRRKRIGAATTCECVCGSVAQFRQWVRRPRSGLHAQAGLDYALLAPRRVDAAYVFVGRRASVAED
jgi:hypothetical protein